MANPPDVENYWGTSRTEAFSDGVFAIAITLLILEVNVPETAFDNLWRGILDQWPSYLAYATSFITIGGIWLAHHGIFRRLQYANTRLMLVNLLLLMAVSFLPFPTKLMAEAIHSSDAERAAVIFYGGTLLVISSLLSALWGSVARDRHLLRPEVSEKEFNAIAMAAGPNIGLLRRRDRARDPRPQGRRGRLSRRRRRGRAPSTRRPDPTSYSGPGSNIMRSAERTTRRAPAPDADGAARRRRCRRRRRVPRDRRHVPDRLHRHLPRARLRVPGALRDAKTRMSRGLAATVTVLGTAVAVTLLALLLLVPLVGGVRDFLQELPATVQQLRDSDELSWLGDSGAAENVQAGAEQVSASVPDAISARARDRGRLLLRLPRRLHDPLHLPLPAHDIANLKRALGERAHARRGRALARSLGAGDDRGLALGDRRRRHRDDRRHDAGRHRVAARLELRRRARRDRGAARHDPQHRRDDRRVHPRADALGRGGAHRGDHHARRVLVYQQVENNILTPKIQGKAVNLSAFFIIVAVTLFGALLGVLGALTAVPLAATIQIFVQELTKARREQVAAAHEVLEPV